jgi:Ca-activated chloride channel family protein
MSEVVIMTDADVERWSESKEEKGFGALQTAQGPLPLKALDLHTNIEGLIAETTLTERFVNTHREPLEATYIFPLSDRAAVTSFRLEVAGRVVEGVLKERGEARKEYEEALQAGHRAAITEEERPGVFTIRVGNLPAGETATVRLTLVGSVIFDAGEVTYRFPLVVAPRYIPGTPLPGGSVGDGWAPDTDAVPDASRITPPVLLPGYPYPVQLNLTVDVVGAGLPAEKFRSSLHAVTSETVGGATRIAVQPGERINRDFILRYHLGTPSTAAALTLVPDADVDAGTFMLTLLPPAGSAQATRPRDLVFVLDRSGSMAGWKMVAARRALGRMIDTLTERDRFTVYAFDDTIEVTPVCGDSVAAASDRNRYRTIEWLAKVDARGGTEMAQPLDQAVRQLTGNRDRVLVLITDGQVGNEDQILASLAQRLQGIRIFTLGVDRAVNEAFLRRLAALGGGSCDVVESEDRLDEVMDKVQRRIGNPLLTGLHLEPAGLKVESDSLVPARLPDLFPGVPLTVFGRYRGAADGQVVLQAADEAGAAVTFTAKANAGHCRGLAQVWARGRLRDLEDRWVTGEVESPQALQESMVALSLKFGVLCRFTAFVAVDRTEVVNSGGKVDRILQPVEPAEGWDMLQPPAGAAYKLACAAPLAVDSYMMEDSCMADSEYELAEAEEPPQPVMKRAFGGVARSFYGATPAPSAPIAATPAEELTAYRKRAEEMLQRLTEDGDKAHALGVLAVQLRALLDDLRSVGADTKTLAPLEQLLHKLQLPIAQLDVVWAEAEKVLAAFAGVQPSHN